MEKPIVSVIVPVYGVEKYIERCARSLMAQTLQKIEYVFVDDCTTDNSIKILESIFKEYPYRNVRIVHHKKNQGLASARKTGFENAKGEYWICCDSDDWVEPNMYERMLQRAEETDADIVCCGLYKEDTESHPVHYEFKEDTSKNILNPKYFGWVYGAIWNKLVKSSLYRDNGIAPWVGINMWEDSCLTLRLRLLSKRTVILDDCLYHYNVENTNSITYNFNKGKVLQMIEATKRIESFLCEHEYSSMRSPLLKYLKVACKEVLLRYPTRENVKLFKDSFPENNRYLLLYPNWNIILRLRAWLVATLPLCLAFPLLKIMRK